jgi:hypothetical protein
MAYPLPTGAGPPLTRIPVESPHQRKVGRKYADHGRCQPYAFRLSPGCIWMLTDNTDIVTVDLHASQVSRVDAAVSMSPR